MIIVYLCIYQSFKKPYSTISCLSEMPMVE